MIQIKKLDHVQICIPHGKEDEASAFYTDILHFKEIPKPIALQVNGGLWYEVGDIQFHIGCEDAISISKRHIAFEVENINLLKTYLIAQNVTIKEDIVIPDCERFSIIDPFQNRIEFLEKNKNYNSNIIQYWQAFLQKNIEYKNHSIPYTDSYCNDKESANLLAELVRKDIKTASCAALIDYQLTGDPLPKVNELKIIVDWDQNPVCIIKILSVELKKYKEVDADYARKEGEGDLTLQYWQEVHKAYFSNYLVTIGVAFCDELLLVCEEFERIG